MAWNPWELLGPILGVLPSIFHPGAIWQKFSGRDRTHLGGFPMAFGALYPNSLPHFCSDVPSWVSHPWCIIQRYPGKDRTHPDGFPMVSGHLIPTP